MMPIGKVGVIGAGVMGAGIAAQVANAGVPVVLLDIVPPGANNRSQVAEGAVARMLKTDPAPFMTPRAARLVQTGNIDDDLGQLAGCDWIIEAIVENPEIKQALYRRIEAVRRPGCAISSNTSTIPLHVLTAGMPDGFAQSFLITHFFNPPRIMRLIELVAGPQTDPAVAAAVGAFADSALGKTVVRCNDAPGFIANRVGNFWLQAAVVEAVDGGLTVEEADAIIGRPFGIPRTGVFGLLDLVGLDLMPHVNASLGRTLAPGDPFHAINRPIPLFARMVAEGYTGRKGKGGFYLFDRATRTKQAIDLATGAYRPEQPPDLPELALGSLRALMEQPTRAGRYAWRVMGQTLAYAAAVVPEAAESLVDIDDAMRLGYNWRWGPFELIDQLGTAWFAERLAAAGWPVPPLLAVAEGRPFYRIDAGQRQALTLNGAYRGIARPDGVLLLADIRRTRQPVLENGSASLWDIGDGVACLEFTGKANAIDAAVIALITAAVPLVQARFKALVIYNEGAHFSAGADLAEGLSAATAAAWGAIEAALGAGQRAFAALKYAPFPVVAAPAGLAVGGGCEILLHADAVQAYAESLIGLVECSLGLVPGWGGCTAMLTRAAASGVLPRGPMPVAAKLFELISTATVSKSAAEAQTLGYLRPQDGITMNRDRLLADAKARALALVPGYAPPEPSVLQMAGPSGAVALRLAAEDYHRRGLATDYDLVVATGLAEVLTGGTADPADRMSEAQMLAVERAVVMRLIRNPSTLARIQHTLETGKPLRN